MFHTLDEVNKEIERLAGLDIQDALFGQEHLFEALIRVNNFYILADADRVGDTIPYLAPLVNDELMFLRLFSHKEAAEAFVTILESPKSYLVKKIDIVQLIQLSKLLFLIGVEGSVLNDGQAWTSISNRQLLTTFYKKNLKNKSCMDNNYVLTVDFINALNNQGKIFYSKRKNNYLLHREESENVFTLDTLLRIVYSESKAVITYPDMSFSGPIGRIKPVIEQIILYKRAIGLNLHDLVSINNIETVIGVPINYKSINPYLTHTRPETPKPIVEKAKMKQIKKPKWPILKPLKGYKNPTPLILLVIAGAIIIVLLYTGASRWSTTKSLGNFEKGLNNGNYSEAFLIYDAYDSNSYFLSKANPLIGSNLEGLLDDYINEKVDEDEFLNVYNSFKVLNCEDELLRIYEDFILVKDSKSYFEFGKYASTALVKLYNWQFVSEIDRNNYNEVQADFKQNTSVYYTKAINILDVLIKEQKTEDVFRGIEALDYWYPEDSSLYKQKSKALALGQYDTFAVVSDGSIFNVNNLAFEALPVDISSTSTVYYPQTNRVDLYIKWRNVSNKSIKEINFFALPTGETGGRVETLDSYSLFQAKDIGPYLPGEGTPSSNWAWKAAWTGETVKGAEIVQTIVVFSDGDIRSLE